jgi:hypothetical protein
VILVTAIARGRQNVAGKHCAARDRAGSDRFASIQRVSQISSRVIARDMRGEDAAPPYDKSAQ